MSQEMYFRRGASVFGISYAETVSATPEPETSTIYVAASSLNVSVEVWVNGNRLKEDGTLNLLQRQFENAPIWKSLMFSFVKSEKNPDPENFCGDLQLTLRCDLFHPKIPDLAFASNVRFLQSIALKYEHWSPHRVIYYEDLFDTLQYSLTSLMINLEFRFPFIFSYYGKSLVKINYQSLIRNSTLLATPLDNGYVPDHNVILATVLEKLQSAILYEFNILNVMKECDLRPWQAQSCRKNVGLSGVACSRKSIKSKGVDLRPLCEVLSPSGRDEIRSVSGNERY